MTPLEEALDEPTRQMLRNVERQKATLALLALPVLTGILFYRPLLALGLSLLTGGLLLMVQGFHARRNRISLYSGVPPMMIRELIQGETAVRHGTLQLVVGASIVLLGIGGGICFWLTTTTG